MFNREVVSYITMRHEFNGIRLFNNLLIPTKWKMKVNLAGIRGSSPMEDEEFNKRVSVTYQKIKVWLEYFVSDVIVASSDDLMIDDFVYAFDNLVVVLPHRASDDIFIEALHSKICALAVDDILVGEMSLISDDSGSEFHFCSILGGDNAYSLPAQEEWIEIESAVFEKPWWKRNDCDTFEPCIEEGKTREECAEMADTGPMLDSIVAEIHDSMYGSGEEDEDEVPKVAEIIQLNPKKKWTPTILSNE